MFKKLALAIPLVTLVLAAVSCGTPSSTPTPIPTTTTTLTPSVLKFRILDAYPNYFWCDPDYYPIGRLGGEQANAIARFDSIRSNDEEFTAILNRLQLDRKPTYTPEEQLLVYRQHKLLNDVLVTFQSSSAGSEFVIRVGQNQGQRIEGNISVTGTIEVTTTETSFNTCPICLSKGTLIESPIGPVPVEELTTGSLIWTMDGNGLRIAAPIIQTTMTPVPTRFDLLNITLADGRALTASPRHPTADGKLLGNLKSGDILDGSIIVKIETVAYEGRTYDILPAGGTGFYWANGVLLGSTLANNDCGC
jgi:hypothetical protein